MEDRLNESFEQSTQLTESLEKFPGVGAVQSYRAKLMERKRNKPDTAGKGWFDLPAPVMKPELKNEISALYLRSYIYKDRFYKKVTDTKRLPKHFQVGEIIASSAEYYRKPTRKERNKGFVDQILEDSAARQYIKQRFHTVIPQNAKHSKFNFKRQRK